jgi:hypothetical protein
MRDFFVKNSNLNKNMNAINDKYQHDIALINNKLEADIDKLEADIHKLQHEANQKILVINNNYISNNRKYKDGFKFKIKLKNKVTLTEVAEITGTYLFQSVHSNVSLIGYYYSVPSSGESKLKNKEHTITEHELDALSKTITNEIDHMKCQLKDEIELKTNKYIEENRIYLDGFEFKCGTQIMQVCEARLELVKSPYIYYICFPVKNLNDRIKGEGLVLLQHEIEKLLK